MNSVTPLLKRLERLRLKILEQDSREHPVEIVATWGDEDQRIDPDATIIRAQWNTQALEEEKNV